MKVWLALLSLPLSLAAADWTLAICASVSKDYVVGAKLPPSGLFYKTTDGWRHVGYNHPFLTALDYDPRNPSILYLAGGNGLFRVDENWTQLTGSDVTELRDLDVAGDNIYFAHTRGIRVSHDAGKTWAELAGGLHRKYSEAIRVDRAHSGVLVAGGEEGIFRSEDSGKTWRIAGAAGIQVMRIEQSPHDPCFWLATTQSAGIFASTDCAKTFENFGRIGVGRNLYSIAFDPTNPQRIAVAGWGPGVAVTENLGRTWELRSTGLPQPNVWNIIFDPEQPGRLYASVQEAGVFVSEDAGKSWKPAGLEGSVVWRMKFIPSKAAR